MMSWNTEVNLGMQWKLYYFMLFRPFISTGHLLPLVLRPTTTSFMTSWRRLRLVLQPITGTTTRTITECLSWLPPVPYRYLYGALGEPTSAPDGPVHKNNAPKDCSLPGPLGTLVYTRTRFSPSISCNRVVYPVVAKVAIT